MSKFALLDTKTSSKAALSPEHKTFNRLKKKIEKLRDLEKNRKLELDAALKYYYERVEPKKQEYRKAVIEKTTLTYKLYKKRKNFNIFERKLLKQLVLDDVNEIIQMSESYEAPDEIQKIFEDLSGNKYEDMISSNFNSVKLEMEEMFSNLGLDVDLSEIDVKDRDEEMLAKLYSSIADSMSKNDLEHEFERPKKKKTKKQQEKEEQLEKFKEAQSKSLNSIYKQLAKVLHPDLEPDMKKKGEKEELMKKLTLAYQNNDLYTLLALEMQWMDSSGSLNHAENSAQMKLYNSLLKEQVEVFQEKINSLSLHPQYCPITHFCHPIYRGLDPLLSAYEDLSNDCSQLQLLIEDLKTAEGVFLLKKIIHEYSFFNEIFD